MVAEPPEIVGTDVIGTALADPDWLGRRIAALSAAWRVDEPRVAGTLWWYMASATLLDAPVHDRTVDPALDTIVVTLRADGSPAGVRHAGTTDAQPGALRSATAAIIDPLSRVSSASTRSLWAVAADAVAAHCLADPDRAGELAAAIPELPEPRFVEVGGRRFVRRDSCCLIYRSPLAGLCTSCPRRPPQERARLLAELAG